MSDGLCCGCMIHHPLQIRAIAATHVSVVLDPLQNRSLQPANAGMCPIASCYAKRLKACRDASAYSNENITPSEKPFRSRQRIYFVTCKFVDEPYVSVAQDVPYRG